MNIYRAVVNMRINGEYEEYQPAQKYVGTYSSFDIAKEALRHFRGKHQEIPELAVKTACICMDNGYAIWHGNQYIFCVNERGEHDTYGDSLPGEYCYRYCIEETPVWDTPKTTDNEDDD